MYKYTIRNLEDATCVVLNPKNLCIYNLVNEGMNLLAHWQIWGPNQYVKTDIFWNQTNTSCIFTKFYIYSRRTNKDICIEYFKKAKRKGACLGHYGSNIFFHTLSHFHPNGLLLRFQQVIELKIIWSCTLQQSSQIQNASQPSKPKHVLLIFYTPESCNIKHIRRLTV